jgi:two-component system response regulator FixJ
MSKKSPTVFVIDDDEAVLKSAKWLLDSVSQQVQTYPSAQAFLDAYTGNEPGCVVTDIRMPGYGGLQRLETLRGRGDKIPVIVLTAHGDVTTAVRAMKAGAFDFLEKPVNDQFLLDLVNSALEIDRESRRRTEALAMTLEKYESLTAREKEVLALVAAGNTNKEIARDLDISPKTVEAHRARVMEKLSASSVAELVRIASVCL